VVVAVSGENRERCRHLVTGEEWSKVTDVCLGGLRRQDSVAAGLRLLGDCGWVIIHDGARPLVTVALIERALAAARETGAAVPAVPVKDTIKAVDGEGFVRETLPRADLRAVQTPQVFRADIIRAAYQATTDDVTDDASLVERLGCRVKLFPGADDNIKITTPEDLLIAGVLWREHGR